MVESIPWHQRLTTRRRAFVHHRRNGYVLTYRLFCVLYELREQAPGGERARRAA